MDRYIDERQGRFESMLGARVFSGPDELNMAELKKIHDFFARLGIVFQPSEKNPSKEDLVKILENKGEKVSLSQKHIIINLDGNGSMGSTVSGFVGAFLRYKKIINNQKRKAK